MSLVAKRTRADGQLLMQDANAGCKLHPKLTTVLFAQVLAFLDLGDHQRLNRSCRAFSWQPDGGGPVSFLKNRGGSFNLLDACAYLKRRGLDLAAEREPIGDSLLEGRSRWRMLNLAGTPIWPLMFRELSFPNVVEVEVDAREVVEGSLLVENLPQLRVLRLHMRDCTSLVQLHHKKWSSVCELELRVLGNFRMKDPLASLTALRRATPQLQQLRVSIQPHLTMGIFETPDNLIESIAQAELPLRALRIEPPLWPIPITTGVLGNLARVSGSLTELDINGIRLSDAQIKVIGQMQHLEKLHLIRCAGFTGFSLRELQQGALRYFTLYACDCSDPGLSHGLSRIWATHFAIDGKAAIQRNGPLQQFQRFTALGLRFPELPDWGQLIAFIDSRPANEQLLLQLPLGDTGIAHLRSCCRVDFPDRMIRVVPLSWPALRADQMVIDVNPQPKATLDRKTRQVAAKWAQAAISKGP